MYDYLRGRLIERDPDWVVIDVGGVGYGLAVSGTTASRLPTPGDPTEVTIYTEHRVRDDHAVLYGFASREERGLFRQLLGVNKVGPAIALALLSALEPAELAAVVDSENIARLSKVKGVGKRTAERLCMELKGRLTVAAGTVPGQVTDRTTAVAAALVALGYPRAHAVLAAERVCAGAPPDAALEPLVKQALKTSTV